MKLAVSCKTHEYQVQQSVRTDEKGKADHDADRMYFLSSERRMVSEAALYYEELYVHE